MQKTFNLVDNFKVFILYIFILPIVEGIIWSYINTKRFNKDVVRPLFNSMKLNIINPAPTAWDSLFYNDSEKIVEIIFKEYGTYKGGVLIAQIPYGYSESLFTT